MPTYTTNYSLPKPNVNSADDEDLWGDQLNDGMDLIDTQMKASADLAVVSTASKTTDYTIVSTDRNALILVDATSGDVTIDADSSLGDGFRFSIIKTDSSSNSVIFDPVSAQTVNGSATYTIGTQYESANVVTDASNWFVAGAASDAELATAAETLTGTEAAKAITPAGFAGNKSLATDGYYKLPGGLILQWGDETLPAEGSGSVTVTYPVAFSTAVYSVTTSSGIATLQDAHNFAQVIGTPGTTSFVMSNQYVGGSNIAITARWMAIGV
jgi:hypothetical protein